MPINDVIFLGAGASAADGAPLQSQLFSRYFISSRGSNDRISKSLREFFTDFFGIDTDNVTENTDFPTFGEALGMLELAITRNESFRKYPMVPGNPRVQLVKEQLIFLIAKILKEELRSGRAHHAQLVQRLKDTGKLSQTAFISLNYDILIDNALTDLHDTVDLDYGVAFTNFENPNDWHRPRPDRSIPLFKLHGSLNWLYCPTCISLTITPKDKSVSTLVDKPKRCKTCHSNMVPIIIPPTFFKMMSNHFLQQIWHNCQAVLTQATRIIFCGYSFPNADIHIKYLLKRTELSRGSTPDIFIFNDHDGKLQQQKAAETKRYSRFFFDKSKVHYLESSFEDFCKYGLSRIQT